jgi:predicted metal-dependent hydrolase
LDKVRSFNDPQLGEIVFRENANAKRYIVRLHNGKLKVTIPPRGNYTEAKEILLKNKQNLLHKIQLHTADPSPEIDENELRQRAQSILPEQLAQLAGLHGFNYSQVKITKSRSRWGSCSLKGVINLSFYLLLLPVHLVEYVLLHELCHTVEMNHSPAFWALLNRCTQNKAFELRREIRKYRC